MPADRRPTREQIALRFHETYERLAPSFGYETRTETRAFDPDSPNGRLMIAVCGEVTDALFPPASEGVRAAALALLESIEGDGSGWVGKAKSLRAALATAEQDEGK